ncbi:MAG: sigma-70 family RNA polymerase sigma factor [Cytophagales bacterium]|nr:MAG: sigma-70 family RNA polymerase sigma factor [Cytophagales bacterium]TAF60287.1 MAG: sigma-70 family RNA polymerase sigma factor [Cytophagales bacterium]
METSRYDLHHYLVERCLANDRKAQYQIYKLYASAMYNVCMRMVKDEEEAKDVLQDAFVDAFTKLNSFRQDASFGSWLKRVVINRCLNHLNKNKMILEELSDNQIDSLAEEEEDLSFVQEEAQRIMRAIKFLPEGCRLVLNLYLFEGYDHQEIGEILNVTESTSKAQYSKARKKLREILKSHEYAQHG